MYVLDHGLGGLLIMDAESAAAISGRIDWLSDWIYQLIEWSWWPGSSAPRHVATTQPSLDISASVWWDTEQRLRICRIRPITPTTEAP